MNEAVPVNGRREEQTDAEFPELNGYRGSIVPAAAGVADDWKRKLATSQETGVSSADSNKVGYREDLEKILALKRPQSCADVDVRAKREQIQQLRHTDLQSVQSRRAIRARRYLELPNTGELKLLRCRRPQDLA